MLSEGRKPDAVASERSLRRLLAHAWDRSPFYRELYAAHGIRREDLSHVALSDLPVVSKADLMVRFDEAVTDRRLRRADLERWLRDDIDPLNLYLNEYIIVHGSGGTKVYSYVPYTRETWHRMMATAAPLLLPHGTARLRSAFYFWIEGHYVGATSTRLASQAAHDVLSLSVFDPAEEIQARLNAFQPERLHSYASALSWLAEWTLQGKLRIAPRTVLTSGDRLTPAIRAQLKAAWNADIYEVYGACESICIAVRRPEEAEFQVLTESNLLEVVDTANRAVQPGRRGRVLLTGLANATLPIIRFDLHDYAVLGRAAGLGAKTLRRLDGKSYDSLAVRLADGSVGVLEVYELAQLELPGVVKIQLVAHSLSEVEIRYQSMHDLNMQIDTAFRRLLAQKSAVVERVTIRRVEQVANSVPAFKLQWVVKPDQTMFAPVSLAQGDDGRQARELTARVKIGSCFEADPAGSIDQRLARMATARPEHLAAVDGEHLLSYGQLDRLATRVAGELVRRRFDPSRPVAVFCAHRPELLPLIFGVMRAGGIYLPLDSNLSVSRLQAMLAETEPQFLLSHVAQSQSARALAGNRSTVLCLEEMAPASPPKEASAHSPSGPACLLYTSGSTGGPKGVALSHETILARAMRYAADYDLHATDRISLLQSYAVSAGVREIFGALATGATLAFYDVRARGVSGLARWLSEARISVLYAVPTLFRAFLETLSAEIFPAVRVVRLGGEPVQAEEVSGFRRHFSGRCRLVNGYAASETDTICQYVMDHDTRIVAGRVPAGVPVAGVGVTLGDELGNAVPFGTLGEIRVTSRMLAVGYWDALARRVQPFDLPFATGDLGYRLEDGRIFLVARRDLIVKVHGHRIDLSEVERVASAVADVVEAAAVLRPAARSASRIVVFYVARGEDARLSAALRRAVTSVVPERTVSLVFVRLAALPRLPGGKVNRSTLPADPGLVAVPASEAPRYASDTEAVLAHIWREALGVPCVARADDFFDLGGDSITVFRMLGLVEKEFGIELPVGEVFANVALAELARAIDARRPCGK